MKRLALLFALVTLAAACASGADSQSTIAESQEATTVPQASTENGSTPTTLTTDSIGDDGATLVPSPTIPPDAPPAPDFTLALSDGESFTLSEQAMPVYMIFWADW